MGSSTSKPCGTKKIQMPNQGEIEGTILKDIQDGGFEKSFRFTGVPYALPPLGDRRWKKPQPLPCDFQYDSQGRKYTEFGDICLQPTNYSPEISPSPPKVIRSQSEDCLLLNIWVPTVPPPLEGFPVFFYIHGGWLQVGDANHSPMKDPSDLQSPVSRRGGGAGLEAIVVTAGYRLNVFGFLACKELKMENKEEASCGNYGFWDQRLALEWVFENIRHFNGNPRNITLGGLSAGAHSTHSQLLYEFTKSQKEESFIPLIRRIFLQSNAICLPPKTLTEVETLSQFDEICTKVGIKSDLSGEEKLSQLRKIDGEKLVGLLPQMKHHTFRAVDDESADGFVRSDWIENMKNGSFARWCKKMGIQVIIGETSDEQTLYRIINPPTGPDFESSLFDQLHNYYPKKATEALLHFYPKSKDPNISEAEDSARRLGRCASDSQVHAAERCFIDWMTIPAGLTPDSDIFRYRISFRSPILDRYTPEWMGVSHSFDDCLWWFAVRERGELELEKEGEGEKIQNSFRIWLEPFVEFVKGEGGNGERMKHLWYDGKGNEGDHNGGLVRCFEEDGVIRVKKDEWRKERQEVIQMIKTFGK